jgi:succinate-semialdehyde dehydrogenase/glutarate-semialdehyde dehydrogenase
VLELGGSDPFIVLEDADIDTAVQMAVMGRVMNAGQVCSAAKRFIVVDKVYDDFMKKFVPAMTHIVPGDPTDPKTLVGPLSSKEAASDLHAIVQDALDKGAKLESAPAAPEGTAYYAPGVLTGVTPEMRAYREELFGPVAVVHRVPSPQAAVQLANDSSFGLGGSIFSRNVEEAKKLASEVETGMVWINSVTGSTPDLPFGGVKRSGVGRELGKFGVTEFANRKLIRVPQPQAAQQQAAQQPVSQPA